jgi:hypothetical protein
LLEPNKTQEHAAVLLGRTQIFQEDDDEEEEEEEERNCSQVPWSSKALELDTFLI